MSGMSSRGPWQSIPLRDFQNLRVIRESGGEVVATVQEKYAEGIEALPDLLAASKELFDLLKEQHSHWGPNSKMGNLEKALSRFKKL